MSIARKVSFIRSTSSALSSNVFASPAICTAVHALWIINIEFCDIVT